MKLVEVIRAQNTLGEGIVWDDRAQCVWWTDIQERRLYRHAWPSKSVPQVFELPERLCSFGLRHSGDGLIAAFASGIALFDPQGGRTEWLMRLPPKPKKVRFNDGRVDRQGRFWCGTMVEDDHSMPLGQLFCVDKDGSVTCRLEDILISNGLCWSPDSTRLFFADSPHRTIWQFEFDAATGTISNRRTFARTPKGSSPDGADVDAEGGMWSAQWGGSCVARYAGDGTISRTVDTPASQASCVAFGGPHLRHMFVTSARENLSDRALEAEPQAGDVFVFESEFSGLPTPRCAL